MAGSWLGLGQWLREKRRRWRNWFAAIILWCEFGNFQWLGGVRGLSVRGLRSVMAVIGWVDRRRASDYAVDVDFGFFERKKMQIYLKREKIVLNFF